MNFPYRAHRERFRGATLSCPAHFRAVMTNSARYNITRRLHDGHGCVFPGTIPTAVGAGACGGSFRVRNATPGSGLHRWSSEPHLRPSKLRFVGPNTSAVGLLTAVRLFEIGTRVSALGARVFAVEILNVCERRLDVGARRLGHRRLRSGR